MKRKKRLFPLLLAASCLMISCSTGWRVRIPGAANGHDGATAVALDKMGDVVAAGRTTNADTGLDFTVVKLDGASGAELWRQAINGTGKRWDSAAALAVDRIGDVVAAGRITNPDTGLDFTVVKFEGASGAELWRQLINGAANGSDSAAAMTLDGAGNVVAAGSTLNTGAASDFTVIKFDGKSGAELWRQMTKGSRDGASQATGITVDNAGNVVAIGSTFNVGTIYADFTVIKYDGTRGTEMWRRLINGTNDGASGPSAVTVDSAGNVLAVGFTVNARGNPDFTVVKLDGASGAELWRQVLAGNAHGISMNLAIAVAVDSAGDVVVGGRIVNSDTGPDFAVIKFSGADGRELWRQLINGAANGADQALSVVVDAKGDVVAGGRTSNSDSFYDLTVVKFDGISGRELWRQVLSDAVGGFSETVGVALDSAGNVVTATAVTNVEAGSDFAVIKLDGDG